MAESEWHSRSLLGVMIIGWSSNARAKSWLALLLLTVFLSACVSTYHKHDGRTFKSKQNVSLYKVKKGDTLYSIAVKQQKSFLALAELNDIKKPYIIYPGQMLSLPISNVARHNATKNNNNNIAYNKEREYDKSKPILRNPAATRNNTWVKPRSYNSSSANDLRWAWPCEGSVVSRYSGEKSERSGLDIYGKFGSPIKAVASGRVVYSGGGLVGYGNLIIIEHNNEYLSTYAHNSRLISKEGEIVKIGQKIAELGSSGTDQPKLNLEIRHRGVQVDPLRYLPVRN
ncbi:MAG TPA: peptidoglycan DD-metalloendopeptidase family protein [Pseudomonadales bacterium]|nr:peptidoglycan DD-metalloendopeptidase family protein [Pseudomonadales bacterium]